LCGSRREQFDQLNQNYSKSEKEVSFGLRTDDYSALSAGIEVIVLSGADILLGLSININFEIQIVFLSFKTTLFCREAGWIFSTFLV